MMESVFTELGLPTWLRYLIPGVLILGFSMAALSFTGSYSLAGFSAIVGTGAFWAIGLMPLWILLTLGLVTISSVFLRTFVIPGFDEGGGREVTDKSKVMLSVFGIPLKRK